MGGWVTVCSQDDLVVYVRDVHTEDHVIAKGLGHDPPQDVELEVGAGVGGWVGGWLRY